MQSANQRQSTFKAAEVEYPKCPYLAEDAAQHHSPATSLLIVGASHQAEVLLDVLSTMGPIPKILGLLDCGSEGRFVGHEIGQYQVLDKLSNISQYKQDGVGVLAAVGSALLRQEIDLQVQALSMPLLAAWHSNAIISAQATLAAGAVICAGAVISTGASLGRASIANTACIIDHHCQIGDYAHIAPGAKLAGGVQVGERAWIGIGATVLEDIVIGPDAIVGAGAVVTRDVEAGQTVVGIPAAKLPNRLEQNSNAIGLTEKDNSCPAEEGDFA